MTPNCVEDLLEALEAGEKLEYIFFWGHRPRPDGTIGPSCFSQWYEAGFDIDGVHYRTAEHYMMAEKARLFGDLTMAERILKAADPPEVKKLGRQVRHFDSQRWAEKAPAIVEQGNLAKFSQNTKLLRYIRSTAPAILVEASPEDTIWGIGLAREDPRASDPLEWLGTNLLGFALMRVRDQLARVEKHPHPGNKH